MKIRKMVTASLIAFSSLLSTAVTAQETTTLNEVTKQARQNALQKSELNRRLANPTIETTTSVTPTNKKSQKGKALETKMTEADLVSIQKRIDKKKADLAAAKSGNTLDTETIQEKKLEIEKAEKALKREKKKSTMPASKSN
jgi:capsule polysaccharide export protein KpsE/RkpR